MFSRRPDRPRDEPRFAPPSGTRSTDLIAAPLSPTPWAGYLGGSAPDPATSFRREEATVIGEHDHVEGTVRSGLGVLVLGTVIGRIESDLWIRIGETADVRADLAAEEIVVAGRYEGHLVAAERLEIAPTGQVRGEIEAPRMMLHEGGFIDGQLSMTPRPVIERAATADAGAGEVAAIIPVEAAGSVRAEATGPSVRGATGRATADPVAARDDADAAALADLPPGDPMASGQRNGRSGKPR